MCVGGGGSTPSPDLVHPDLLTVSGKSAIKGPGLGAAVRGAAACTSLAWSWVGREAAACLPMLYSRKGLSDGLALLLLLLLTEAATPDRSPEPA